MGKCLYYCAEYDCCGRDSTIGGRYQRLVPCNKCERFKPITNYDRIKAMSKEELAGMLGEFCYIAETCEHCPVSGRCPGTYTNNAWLDWLNSEVEE